jgi:hypothetical protein
MVPKGLIYKADREKPKYTQNPTNKNKHIPKYATSKNQKMIISQFWEKKHIKAKN